MPPQLRIVCAALVLVELFAIMIILQIGGIISLLLSMKATKMICFFFVAYLSLNTIMGIFSYSKKEKYISAPLAALSAMCCWILGFGA